MLNKAAGLVTHPAPGNEAGTLVNALLAHCPTLSGIGGERRPGIVHRLDKDTSGCLVVAKNDLAHRGLGAQFAARTTRKRYLALVRGVPRPAGGTIDTPVGRHPVHRKRMAVARRRRTAARRARITACARRPGGKARRRFRSSSAACTPGAPTRSASTSSTWAIPILGDTLYGGPRPPDRQMLHAWTLGFRASAHRAGAWNFARRCPPIFSRSVSILSSHEPI